MTWAPVGASTRMRTARYRFPGGTSRTVLVEGQRRAVVFSPGASLVSEAERLGGREVVLVAPSMGHTLGIDAWRSAPDVEALVAAEATARRGNFEAIRPDRLEIDLPEGLSLHVPPGGELGEVWMRVEDAGRVHWAVCDAFSNIERLADGLWLRLGQRLYGLRTGLAVGVAFRRKTSDGAALLAWMTERFAGGCDVLIPCHGEIDDGPDLAERLYAKTRAAFKL